MLDKLINLYMDETGTFVEKKKGLWIVSDAYEKWTFGTDDDFIHFLMYNLREMALLEVGEWQ